MVKPIKSGKWLKSSKVTKNEWKVRNNITKSQAWNENWERKKTKSQIKLKNHTKRILNEDFFLKKPTSMGAWSQVPKP
jgi:hypothetical protein